MYNCQRLWNILFMKWLYHVLGPVILGIGSGIVLLLYLSANPEGIPSFIHYWVPVIAFGALLIMSWLWYDVVMMGRESEEAMENLKLKTHPFFHHLEPAERKYLFCSARALRPVGVTIGQFSDMTFEGLVGVWEEILNQFLFLLSL